MVGLRGQNSMGPMVDMYESMSGIVIFVFAVLFNFGLITGGAGSNGQSHDGGGH